MSLEATIWAWEQVPAVSQGARLVLLALADEVRSEKKCPNWVRPVLRGRVCWPGQGRLVERTGLCERTVHAALAELEDKGLIKRRPRMRRSGKGRTSDETELFGPAFCDEPTDDAGTSDQPADHDGYSTNRQISPDGDQPADADSTNRQLSPDQPADSAPESAREPTKNESPSRAHTRKERSSNNNGRGDTKGLRKITLPSQPMRGGR